MVELELYIQHHFGAANEDLKIISSFFKPLELKKGKYFLKAGAPSDRLGFLGSGLLREFLETEGKEVTKWVCTPGQFAVDLSGFFFGTPARWNIQALEDCELFVVNQAEYHKIGQAVPRWAQLEKLFMAKCFATLEERVVSHLSLTAEQRFEQLMDYDRTLFTRAPLQYLASMLGMTPETLSRLRKKASQTRS